MELTCNVRKELMKSQVTVSIAAVLYVFLLPLTKLVAQPAQHMVHTHYSVIDLGTLGGTFSQPGGINEKGDIEGFSLLEGDSQTRAYYLHQGQLSLIPGLGGPNSAAAWAPSETGQVGAAGDTSEPDP